MHVIMNEEEIASRLEGLADEIALRMPPSAKPALVGIQRRGVYLAGRLAGLLAGRLGRELPQGSLDINLYRDDWTTLGPKATVGRTSLNFDLPGRTLILVDDVLYTGRTVRAALEALADFGRPGKVELLALVDRGGRELPIHADYAGLTLHTSDDEQVDVLLRELDGQDQVLLHKKS